MLRAWEKREEKKEKGEKANKSSRTPRFSSRIRQGDPYKVCEIFMCCVSSSIH